MVDFVQKPVTAWDILPNEVKDRHVPTGEIHGAKIKPYTIPSDRLKMQVLYVGPVPDVDTEYSHNLGVTPTFVCIQETTEGVLDRVFLVTKSATSVTVRAKTSGVYAYIYLIV